MTITVSTDNRRSVKALAVLATSDCWHRGHRKGDGRPFYAVPSTSDPSRYYLVDVRACTCPDHASRGVACCHMLAVRMRVAQLQAEQPKRRAAKLAAPVTECNGCNQEANRRRVGGRHLSQAERTPHACRPAAPEVETLAEREAREAGAWGVRPTPSAFTTAASIGGTIQAPEAARRRCLADDVWGVDGE